MKIRANPDRWQLIEELFHQARELDPARRKQFLDEASANDTSLRAEIEALLDGHEQSESLVNHPLGALAADLLSRERGLLPPGKQIGAYRLLSLLGEGGMGEVYLAEDPKLGRKLALKLLPSRFISNPELVSRFAVEARVASSLNHPSIVTVFDIGEDAGVHYIATEFIDGETLRTLISRNQLKPEQAVEIAIQVASALAAGHDAGITHRDIKPENIMVRKDGYVKVLDFGLAKLSEGRHPDRLSASGASLTDPGTVMGTISYMSPEQARGEEVDSRSDVFSLGIVLNEMLTGEAPFKRDTPAATFDAILNQAPNPIMDPNLPAGLERVLAKALEKSRAERYHTPAELLAALKKLRSDMVAPEGSFAKLLRSHRVATIAIGIVTVTIAAGALYLIKRPLAGVRQTTSAFSAAISARLTDQPGPEVFPSLSPDGKSLVYASNIGGDWDIYLQRVGGANPINLTTDSTDDDTQPVFSPSGEQIAFCSSRAGGGIFLMGATGENVRRLTNKGYNATWSPDSQEVAFAEDQIENPASRAVIPSRLWSVKVATGERRLISAGDAVQPHWSPHGQRIAYWALRRGGQRDVWTISSRGGEPIRITDDGFFNWNPTWSPDGRYLYLASDRGGTMNVWRVPVDEESGKVLGGPEPVKTPSSYSQHMSFSRDGSRMAYVQVANRINVQRVSFDSASGRLIGNSVWINQGLRRASSADISPDGQWLAYDNEGETQEDIFVMKSDGSGARQLTDDPYRDRGARWAPDGKRIAFYSDRSGKYEIWLISPDGSGLRQLTFTAGGPSIYFPYWSPDSTRILYGTRGEPSSIIQVDRPWSEQSPQRLPSLDDDPNLRFGAWSWSPDGTKLAGRKSTQAGDRVFGILVFSLVTGEFEQLTDFGERPVWLNDNHRLLFAHKQKLYLVDVKTRRVTEVLSAEPYQIQHYSVSRDDRTIYLSIEVAEADIWLLSDTDTGASRGGTRQD